MEPIKRAIKGNIQNHFERFMEESAAKFCSEDTCPFKGACDCLEPWDNGLLCELITGKDFPRYFPKSETDKVTPCQ